MKQLIFILTTCLLLASCDRANRSYHPELAEAFNGTHQLQRFTTKEEHVSKSSASGGFFLIAGGFSASRTDYSTLEVKFAWKATTGEYILSSLPADRIRVRIVNTDTPYVTFKWEAIPFCDCDEEYLDSNPMAYISYMVVHCKEEDFPLRVDINSLP